MFRAAPLLAAIAVLIALCGVSYADPAVQVFVPLTIDYVTLGTALKRLHLQSGEVFLGGLGAQHDLGRITGRETQHQEDDDRHPDQHRHQQQEPAGEVSPHFSEIVSMRRSKLGWSLKPCTRLA